MDLTINKRQYNCYTHIDMWNGFNIKNNLNDLNIEHFTSKLKIKKVNTKSIKSLNINVEKQLIGQVIDKTYKYTKGIIIKTNDNIYKLVMINDTLRLTDVPVYAVLDN